MVQPIRPTVTWRIAFLGVCLLGVCGCSGQGADGVHDMSGTVTFKGQPVKFGAISFVPDRTKDHSGPAGRADIVDGRFDTREFGQGIRPGPHVIQITGFPVQPPPIVDESKGEKAVEPLFTNYTLNLDVRDRVLNVDVPAEATGPGATP